MDSALFTLTLLSFIGFALAKNSHYRDVFSSRPSQQISILLTTASWIILLLTLGLCIYFSRGYGVLLWFGFMALAVLIVSYVLTVKPLYIKWLVPVLVFFIPISILL